MALCFMLKNFFLEIRDGRSFEIKERLLQIDIFFKFAAMNLSYMISPNLQLTIVFSRSAELVSYICTLSPYSNKRMTSIIYLGRFSFYIDKFNLMFLIFFFVNVFLIAFSIMITVYNVQYIYSNSNDGVV